MRRPECCVLTMLRVTACTIIWHTVTLNTKWVYELVYELVYESLYGLLYMGCYMS